MYHVLSHSFVFDLFAFMIPTIYRIVECNSGNIILSLYHIILSKTETIYQNLYIYTGKRFYQTYIQIFNKLNIKHAQIIVTKIVTKFLQKFLL